MSEQNDVTGVSAATQRYLDLMYDSDPTAFDAVFCPTAQLHGLRDGQLAAIPAEQFKHLLASRPSPQSLGAPREETVLLMDFASPTQALVKVRVRIAAITYVDYLMFHKIDARWLITAKGFHIEHIHAA